MSNPSSRVLRVFLCHSSNDKPAVRDLYRRLRIENIEPWLDEEQLLPGQDWDQEITKAVQATDIVIVCLSRESINKAGYIQKEIKYALDIADEQPEGAIFIIPLKLEECDVPRRLHRWQWVNLFEGRGYGRLILALKARAIAIGIDASLQNASAKSIVTISAKSPPARVVTLVRKLSLESESVLSRKALIEVGEDAFEVIYNTLLGITPPSPENDKWSKKSKRILFEIGEVLKGNHTEATEFLLGKLRTSINSNAIRDANTLIWFLCQNFEPSDVIPALIKHFKECHDPLLKARLLHALGQLKYSLDELELSNIDLSGTRLFTYSAMLRGLSITNATLNRIGLQGADLTGCNLAHTKFKDAWLPHIRLDSAILIGADFSGKTYMAHASLKKADLRDANFSGANLGLYRGTEDDRASLQSAFIEGANFESADLSYADLSDCSGIRNVVSWESAIIKGVIGVSKSDIDYMHSEGAIIEKQYLR